MKRNRYKAASASKQKNARKRGAARILIRKQESKKYTIRYIRTSNDIADDLASCKKLPFDSLAFVTPMKTLLQNTTDKTREKIEECLCFDLRKYIIFF
jgi:hypothetical protein